MHHIPNNSMSIRHCLTSAISGSIAMTLWLPMHLLGRSVLPHLLPYKVTPSIANVLARPGTYLVMMGRPLVTLEPSPDTHIPRYMTGTHLASCSGCVFRYTQTRHSLASDIGTRHSICTIQACLRVSGPGLQRRNLPCLRAGDPDVQLSREGPYASVSQGQGLYGTRIVSTPNLR